MQLSIMVAKGRLASGITCFLPILGLGSSREYHLLGSGSVVYLLSLLTLWGVGRLLLG